LGGLQTRSKERRKKRGFVFSENQKAATKGDLSEKEPSHGEKKKKSGRQRL